MPPAYDFFAAHTAIFDRVRVIARVQPVSHRPANAIRADGMRVEFFPVPCYAGPWAYLRSAKAVFERLRSAVEPDDVLLVRCPSQLATTLLAAIPARRYGIEVLGDPYELYAPGASRGLLRPLYRHWFTTRLRQQCRNAVVAGYVSTALERRYPSSRPGHRMLDVHLAGIPPRPRQFRAGMADVVTVGGFDHPVKGHDTLIDALAIVQARGLPVRLTIIGGGRLRPELEAQARRRRVDVRFAGELGGASAVGKHFWDADLFALATRSEGTPRALIEAMAHGLPSVATPVGGITELLPASQLAPPNRPRELAERIETMLKSPEAYESASHLGLAVVARFAEPIQAERRRRFLTELRHLSESGARRSYEGTYGYASR